MQPVMTPIVDETTETMTFEAYLERYETYEGGRTEWLAGKVAVYPMSNNVQHNHILAFFTTLLTLFLGFTRLGKIVIAGVPMKYSDDYPAREPDLMILLTPHLDQIADKYVDGIADVVIEIVSPDSVARDHVDKFREFERAGVPEYWMFDPMREDAAIWALDQHGRYRRVPLDAQGRLVSPLLPGFALDPALLWRSSLPDGQELWDILQAMLIKSN
jgi:Uma2 family endonuclease